MCYVAGTVAYMYRQPSIVEPQRAETSAAPQQATLQAGQAVQPNDSRLLWLKNVHGGEWDQHETVVKIRKSGRNPVPKLTALEFVRMVYQLSTLLATSYKGNNTASNSVRKQRAGQNVLKAFLYKGSTYVSSCITAGTVLNQWEDTPEWKEYEAEHVPDLIGIVRLSECCTKFAGAQQRANRVHSPYGN